MIHMLRVSSILQRGYGLSPSLALPPENRSIACTISAPVLALVILMGIGVQARADDPHLGVIEYEISCMPCHGINGRGDGRIARSLKTPPADLTRIAKSNGGEFPFAKVADIIDGRAIVAAHGQREMPVWGDRYRRAIEADEPAAAIERRARAQITALVRYIEQIQAK
jgi:mono/diheme cytochrome c family protein